MVNDVFPTILETALILQNLWDSEGKRVAHGKAAGSSVRFTAH